MFFNETCHYFENLKRLCIKIDFNYDDDNKVTGIEYDEGCFTGTDPQLFQQIEIGKAYDYSKSISVEVRSNKDPYMVFAYTRDNLGTDFTMFLILSIVCGLTSLVSLLVICFHYNFNLEKFNDLELQQMERGGYPNLTSVENQYSTGE